MASFRGMKEVQEMLEKVQKSRRKTLICISFSGIPGETIEVFEKQYLGEKDLTPEQRALAIAYLNCFGSVSIKVKGKVVNGSLCPSELELLRVSL